MPVRSAFEYAIVRVVPDIVREEHLNVGVIVHCADKDLLLAIIELDKPRLEALAPGADSEELRVHLATIPRLCAGGPAAGPMGALSTRERFHWLTAPRNDMIQTSRPHAGVCDDPQAVLERLMERVVRVGQGPR